jgi:hypothetical protein
LPNVTVQRLSMARCKYNPDFAMTWTCLNLLVLDIYNIHSRYYVTAVNFCV